MTSTTMLVRDAAGNLIDIAQESVGNVRTPRHAPEVNGSAVGPSNPMPSALPAGAGTDHSINKPTLQTVLKTIPANAARVGFYLQNQSASQIQIVLDQDDTGASYTVILVDPGNGANGQGADWSMAQAGIRHSARIRICSAANAQFAAREY